MKRKIRTLIVGVLSSTIGNLLVITQPKKVTELSEKGVTNLRNTDRLTWQEKLMRRAILKKMRNKGDTEHLADLHRNYWRNQGHDFFSMTKDIMKQRYLPDYEATFQILKEHLSENPTKFKTLVEIGTGDGSVLEYLGSQFPNLERLVGIDLSPVQVENNNKLYKGNPKLQFVASDGYDWIDQNGEGDTIYVTFRGVLEYFTQPRLQSMLKILNGQGDVLFFAIEPNGPKHDFDKNPESEIYGGECAFSHNYPKLFKEAGFTVWHLSRRVEGEHNDITCIIGAQNF